MLVETIAALLEVSPVQRDVSDISYRAWATSQREARATPGPSPERPRQRKAARHRESLPGPSTNLARANSAAVRPTIRQLQRRCQWQSCLTCTVAEVQESSYDDFH